jgi:hypothetical protein
MLRSAPNYPKTLSTGEVATLINGMLGARVFSDKMVRAEIDEQRLAPVRNVLRRSRRHIRVSFPAFLVWARDIVTAEQHQRLVELLADRGMFHMEASAPASPLAP